MATWQQCPQEELGSSGRGLAGRVQAYLLRENQQQVGRPWGPQSEETTQEQLAL